MPLPEGFVPIYTKPLTVDPVYRRYGLDQLSSGIAAGAAMEYAEKFSGGAALGRAAELMEARGQDAAAPMELRQRDTEDALFADQMAEERRAQNQQRVEMGLAPIELPPAPPAYPDVTMRAPKALSPLLQPDELNKRFGVQGRLKFTTPEYEDAARLLNEWAIEDITREETLRRAEGGLWPNMVRLGAGFVGSMLDPLNIAAAFMPVIPEAMFASAMMKAGGLGARSALRFGKGAVEGAAGTAALEPLVYFQSQAEQADYGLWDSLANVAFGTVLGGGLHAGGGATAEMLRRMPWRERADILRGSVGQMADRGEVRAEAAVPGAAAARRVEGTTVIETPTSRTEITTGPDAGRVAREATQAAVARVAGAIEENGVSAVRITEAEVDRVGELGPLSNTERKSYMDDAAARGTAGEYQIEKLPREPSSIYRGDTYTIRRNGEPIAGARIRAEADGTAIIDDIWSGKASSDGTPNTLGPREVRQIAREFLRQNPEVKGISGRRVTGARGQTGEATVSADRASIARADPGAAVTDSLSPSAVDRTDTDISRSVETAQAATPRVDVSPALQRATEALEREQAQLDMLKDGGVVTDEDLAMLTEAMAPVDQAAKLEAQTWKAAAGCLLGRA